MINNRTDKIRLLNYLIAGPFILIFVGLIITSRSLAQWPSYSDYGGFSDSFFNPSLSLSNSPYYGNYPLQTSSSGLWSRGLESFGNYQNWGGSNSYNNYFLPYNNSFPSAFSSYPRSLSGGLYGGPYGGSYALSPNYNYYSNGRGYDFFSTGSNLSFEPNPYPYMTPLSLGPWVSPSPWQGVTVTAANNWWSGMPTVIPMPKQSSPQPLPAPQKINGEWQSQQLDEDGDLKINRENKILEMLDSSLPLGEGSLTKFSYRTTRGEAPISFKAEFDSGYTAEFTGTADNALFYGSAYGGGQYFIVEGEYVIKDSTGQRVDKGTFKLQYGSPL